MQEKKPGVIILPIPVVEVTGEEHEGDLLFNRERDEIPERLARSPTKYVQGSALVERKALKGAIQVDICGSDKFEFH